MSNVTAKQIENMDYGTPAQMGAADQWYARFMRFRTRNMGHEIMIEAVWERIHLRDVWYQARRRWMTTL